MIIKNYSKRIKSIRTHDRYKISCDCLLLKGVSDFFEFQGFLSSVAAENDFFRIFQPDLMRATRNQILILYTP